MEERWQERTFTTDVIASGFEMCIMPCVELRTYVACWLIAQEPGKWPLGTGMRSDTRPLKNTVTFYVQRLVKTLNDKLNDLIFYYFTLLIWVFEGPTFDGIECTYIGTCVTLTWKRSTLKWIVSLKGIFIKKEPTHQFTRYLISRLQETAKRMFIFVVSFRLLPTSVLHLRFSKRYLDMFYKVYLDPFTNKNTPF